ncbi:hydrogenase expression protein HypF [Streptomyces verrucosisporus]|uniref:hydrogenase expression protein HypF n=1 Tax=Streptomyces verrucosisporus TaxID=1695161 RepID=UPI0019D27737|nr:hydrogenase expression protein HypF [Streptomyces verrucosisporus]MBN3931501.1 hydrogenase expression protein HypF [Streptomyces verrucosisporus]
MNREDREAAAGSPRRTRTGPRHAAPRKPLLTRLHVPAGKAIALAAMPSAVLMGMGLTPKLALAEPLPENPFRDGPCVTTPDKEAEEDSGREAEKSRPGQDGKESGDGGDESGKDAKPGATPAPEPGATAPAEPPADGGTGGEEEDAGTPEPEPSPSESEERNPLDPLGIGDAIKDLFTPDGKKDDGAQAEAEAEPSASPSPSRSGEPGESGDDGSDTPVKDAVEGVAGGVEKGLKDTTDRVGDAVEDTVGKAREKAGEAADDATVPGADASGKEPFPCPTYDAEALAGAEEERTEAVLPNAPWLLETSLLALHGLDYHGIVKVRTHNGTVKNVLKFTARSVDIRDLHQLVEGPGGSTAHVKAAKGSTSTIRNGTVTMYTEELKGKLFGLIPITFSPESPPPLNIPEVFFTDVSVRQAGQFGGELHIPGMNLYNEN